MVLRARSSRKLLKASTSMASTPLLSFTVIFHIDILLLYIPRLIGR